MACVCWESRFGRASSADAARRAYSGFNKLSSRRFHASGAKVAEEAGRAGGAELRLQTGWQRVQARCWRAAVAAFLKHGSPWTVGVARRDTRWWSRPIAGRLLSNLASLARDSGCIKACEIGLRSPRHESVVKTVGCVHQSNWGRGLEPPRLPLVRGYATPGYPTLVAYRPPTCSRGLTSTDPPLSPRTKLSAPSATDWGPRARSTEETPS